MRIHDFTEIDELEISIRLANCLRMDGYRWIWQVRRTPDRYLMYIPNFGKVSLNELRRIVPFELRGNETALNGDDYEGRRRLYTMKVEPWDWIDVIAGNGEPVEGKDA